MEEKDLEEQIMGDLKEYWEELEADYWVSLNKENNSLFNY